MSCPTEGDSVKIFLRVRRPELDRCEAVKVNTAENKIILQTKPPKVFNYDDVGDVDITQEAVFSIVGQKIIKSCIAGYNGTIFAYGQTGSGKTFTMLGPSENAESFHHELRGVIPRSFEYLYNNIAQQQEHSNDEKQFLCRCSFLEIYQEQIFDLLDPTSQGLNLRESLKKGVFVDGLIEKVICNPNDAYKVLISGWLNRRVAATSMNRESSRSHAVFTLNIESKETAHGVQTIRRSCLNMVDLAGSERQKDTNTGGIRLKEAGSINLSLHVLGNVIKSLVDLSDGKKRHIPYRDSKLTFLLKDSLGGNAKTCVVACVHPDSRCFGETLSTLNFARSAKLIKNKAVVNEDFHGSHVELQKEICRLKELLEVSQSSQSICHGPALDNVSTEVDLSADSFWKKYFIEAMYFREASDKEKKGLQDTVKNLQEVCDKKDKFNQSTKMIVKFREKSIASLQKQLQTPSEAIELEEVTLLKEEIKMLQQQLECNPQLAKYSGENKTLRNELEQLRAQSSLNDVLCNASVIDELETVFKELKLSTEAAANTTLNSVQESPSKDKRLAEARETHKTEVKGYQKEIEMLKQNLHEANQKSETQLMEMDVELVSCRNMISELEHALEAHQLKARAENNVLKDLHCQTLMVIASPSTSKRKESVSSLNQSGCQQDDNKDGVSDCSMPHDMVEVANDAVLEEMHTLMAEKDKLQQNIDANECEILKLKQELEKKEFHCNQQRTLLEKERQEFANSTNNHTSVVNSLREELDKIKTDHRLLKEENFDLHLVLKSADKQLKEEKENHKKFRQTSKLEMQKLDTQLFQKCCEFEQITREFNEIQEELASLKEDYETTLTTKLFYESRAQDLEQALHQETKNREKLEAQLETMKSAEDVAELQKSLDGIMEDYTAKLESKDAELNTLTASLLHKDGIIAENKDIVSNLMSSMQEMKTQLTESQSSCSALKMESENASQELVEVRKDLDGKSAEVIQLETQLKTCKEKFEVDLQKKDFEIANLQEDQESNSDSILALEQALDAKENQLQANRKRIEDLQWAMDDLRTRTKLQEMESLSAQLIASNEKNVRESLCSFKSVTSEKVRSLEVLLNKKDEDLKAALNASETANNSLQLIQAESNSFQEQFKNDLKFVHEEKEMLLKELQNERETNARLIGHNNHQQKIRLLDKKNQEYNALNLLYHDLLKEHSRCAQKKSSVCPSPHHKLEDITNSQE